MQFPIEVAQIKGEGFSDLFSTWGRRDVGKFVAIRPCAEEHEKKTYLGLYLGDFPLSMECQYDRDSKTLTVSPSFQNPAIFVFDLNKVIFGCASWWGVIKSEAALKQITDADIEDIWYVRALKQIAEAEEARNEGSDE